MSHLWLSAMTTADVCDAAAKYTGKSLEIGGLDGKTIGTVIENSLRGDLANQFDFKWGSSSKGLDLKELEIDIKATRASSRQNSTTSHRTLRVRQHTDRDPNRACCLSMRIMPATGRVE